MHELEHIVKELKAQSSTSQTEDSLAQEAPTFGAAMGLRPASDAAEPRMRAVRAVAEEADWVAERVAPARDAPPEARRAPAEPLRAQRDDRPVADPTAAALAASRGAEAPARPSEAAPVTAASRSSSEGVEASGARPKRPGRKLFSDTPRAERGGSGGGSGGGAVPPSGGSGREEPRGLPFWINSLGAVAAVALIVGVGLWTYRLGQRDAMEVPIVRALEGPARVQPADPGGAQIAHQGLAVNEVLDGGGVASVAEMIRTAPGDEGAQPEDKAAGALVGLSEATSPSRRPLSPVGANADTEARASVAIDDVLAMAHERLAEANRANTADSEAAERDAIDAIVSAIAEREGTPLPQVTVTTQAEAEQAEADAVQAAERQAAEAQTTVVAANETPAAPAPVTTKSDAPQDIAETGAGVSRPPLGLETNSAEDVAVAQATEPAASVQPAETVEEEPPVMVAAVALTPTPPAGEGSAFAPVSQAQPRARPRGLAAEMRAAVDAAVGTATGQPAVQAEPAPVQTAAVQPAPSSDDASEIIPLPAGTRMIQIGAFDSASVAEQQWVRFASLHSDLLGSKSHYIQRTNNSGRVFYRLRVAGYESKEDTRAACSALSARGLPCIFVTLR